MLRGGRWASVSRHIVEYRAHLIQDAVALGKMTALLERYPCALVFAVATLYLLMDAFLDFALEDTGPRGLVVVGNL